jgi:hypothetical protein
MLGRGREQETFTAKAKMKVAESLTKIGFVEEITEFFCIPPPLSPKCLSINGKLFTKLSYLIIQ